MNLYQEVKHVPDCIPRCRSNTHGAQIVAATIRGTTAEVQAYYRWLCYNFAFATDCWGRTALHMAASCGKWEVVEWLIHKCHSDLDVRDKESGWTALHRSLFYGQLSVARILWKNGASLRITDHEGLIPLELIMKDRLPYVEYTPSDLSEIYVWGSNTNFNLGMGNGQSRTYPEILENFRRDSVYIKQVVMCKFHTAFLSTRGKVFTCGHGHGGRLGQNSEQTALTPSALHGVGESHFIEVSAGQDHLVLLSEGGQIWTCGLNTYHQLGVSPPPERVLSPRQLSLKFLKGKEIVGVCAARFHSVLYTKDAVFTFGLNAGQLGHPKGDRTQILPRQVAGLDHQNVQITHVAASDGATVCATRKGDVYVLHEYQCRKIASRQLEIQKLSIVGGHLDAHCDVAGVTAGGGLELRVVLLTKSGKIYIWKESALALTRCLFTIGRQLLISDVQVNHFNIAMVTKDGEAFLGNIIGGRERQRKTSESSTTNVVGTKVNNSSTPLVQLLEKEECELVRVKRLPHVHRAVSISCDSKGRNFAVLQSHPKTGLIEIPSVLPSHMLQDMKSLLEETDSSDLIHDVVIKVADREYSVHRYILASRSEFFRKQFQSADPLSYIFLDKIQPWNFEQVLHFIYHNTCDLLVDGKEVYSRNSSNQSDVKMFKNLEYTIDSDFDPHKVSAIKVVKQKKHSKKSRNKVEAEDLNEALSKTSDPIKCVQDTSLRLGVKTLSKRPELYDVCLLSEDKVEFPCHRCVLVARLDYFRSMLGSGWIETNLTDSLPLPIPSEILEIIVEYMYTDEAPKVFACEDPEFVCNVLVIADQLLITHLKSLCEVALTDLITLRNVAELLQLSYTYNADQLRAVCQQYICINLAAVLENGSLDVVDDEVMEDLTKSYQNLIPAMCMRKITPYTEGPTSDELEKIAQQYCIDADEDVPPPNTLGFRQQEAKAKAKRKSQSHKPNDLKERQKCESTSSELEPVVQSLPCLSILAESFEKMENMTNIDVSSNHSPSDLSENCGPLSPSWSKTCSPRDPQYVPSFKDIMLEQEENRRTISEKGLSPNSESKKIGRLSQKQKKKLANTHQVVVNKAPITTPTQSSVPVSPKENVWGIPSTTRFQQTACSEGSWSSLSHFPSLLESKHENLSGLKVTPKSETLKTSNCSKDQDTEAGEVSNPWQRGRTAPDVPNLQEIQQAEEAQQQSSVKSRSKPLNLIHLEDQAIEELLNFYHAKDNPEERITVQRVLPEQVAAPIWKKN
ncbi:inhibitor of Bruton tyrosine kinase-like [Limulus polyphemus]|uniref:Inhibitor of Bruton tyrosine kinase-like n=1 Tax=Limulus polyphemus TaxID=6850 RepID=A0ABM1B7I7_LIMPO|nr:inhibitor of Bruton tyrosine kinase-like [Limulus polyphemus]